MTSVEVEEPIQDGAYRLEGFFVGGADVPRIMKIVEEPESFGDLGGDVFVVLLFGHGRTVPQSVAGGN